MERDSSKNKALEQGAHDAQDDAVRTEGTDSHRTEGAMAGTAAARGGNTPKVYHRRTAINDGLRPDLVIGMTTILKGRLEVEMDGDDVLLTFEL